MRPTKYALTAAMKRPIRRISFLSLAGLLLVLIGTAKVALANETYVQTNAGDTTPTAAATPLTCFSAVAGSACGSANYNALGVSSTGEDFAIASWIDTVSYTNTQTQPGFLQYTVSLDGTLSAPGLAQVQAFLYITEGESRIGSCGFNYGTFTGGSASVTCTVQVQTGPQTFDLQGYLEADTFTGGSANLLSTFDITSINLLAADGSLVGPVELTGISGTTYGAPPTPTPEPSTVILLSTSLLGLMGMGLYKRRLA